MRVSLLLIVAALAACGDDSPADPAPRPCTADTFCASSEACVQDQIAGEVTPQCRSGCTESSQCSTEKHCQELGLYQVGACIADSGPRVTCEEVDAGGASYWACHYR